MSVAGNEGSLISTVTSAVLGASAAKSPVQSGTHTYLIVYAPGADGPFFDDSKAKSASPTPFFGAVNTGSPPFVTPAADQMPEQMGTLLEEVGHYWLVKPDELTFRIDGRDEKMDVNQWEQENAGVRYTGPLLCGRTNQHWGVCLQA